MILFGQVKNLLFVVKLIGNVYLVDNVLIPTEQDTQLQCMRLLALTGLTLLPLAITHYFDFSKFSWKVGGKARLNLATGLMNAFLYFDDTARTDIDAGDVVEAMTHDTDQLIKVGYSNFLHVFEVLGKIVCCIGFQLLAPLVFGSNSASVCLSVLPLLVFPVMMFMLLFCRMDKTRQALSMRIDAQRHLMSSVHKFVGNFRLVADFGKRQWLMDMHQENVKQFSAADKASLEVLENNVYFMKWLTALCLSAYVVHSGMDVIQGRLRPGIFLTCLRVFVQVGSLWGMIYKMTLQMLNTFPALERMIDFINRPSDTRARMVLTRRQHEYTQQRRSMIQQELQQEGLLVGKALLDKVPIQIKNTSVHLRALDNGAGRQIRGSGALVRTTCMYFDNLEIQQGQLVSFVGKRGMGKSTLLRLLGGSLLPTTIERDSDSMFFIPSHLRVLHVPPEAMFFKGNLYQVLTFGLAPQHPDADVERVRQICERLGVPERMINAIDEDSEQNPSEAWADTLSGSEKHMLVIARALITNPEVLCIHKPTLHVNDQSAKTIINLLREFVDERGVCLEKDEKHLRRPRTCILTSTRASSMWKADSVFKIQADHLECESVEAMQDTISRVPAEQVKNIGLDELC